MKVVSSEQMARIESLAETDGASEFDYMEEAGSGIALVVHDYLENNNLAKNVTLICGRGNNAGDAYVAGIHLLHLDCEVSAFQLNPIDSCTELCQENYHRFLQEGGRVMQINHVEELFLHTQGVIIDGIFGTGFHGEVREPVLSIIKALNKSGLPIIAVDIPSGLNGSTGEVLQEAIHAEETAFLGLPKTGFFLRQGWDCVGTLRYVDFGLPQPYIEKAKSDFEMISSAIVAPLLPRLKNSRHKYQAGYVIALAGSKEMPGAAILSCTAALRSGAGIVRLLHSQESEQALISSPPEIIRAIYDSNNIPLMAETINKASSVFIGPGLGRSKEVSGLLSELLPLIRIPCVLDADALYFLAAKKSVSLPEKTILTPHRGEMDRLLGIHEKTPLTLEYLQECQKYADSLNVTLILKGGPTFIFQKDRQIAVNSRGSPGMATAGCGDVLTGLIAGFLAQGLSCEAASKAGVYIHAIAGECAASEYTPYCMIASDVLYRFPEGFMLYERP